MPENQTGPPEQEIQQLREEVRRLREEQQSGNGSAPAHENADGEPVPEKKRHPVRNTILALVGLLLLIGGVLYWLYARQFESTDDAQVDGHISGIASRIAAQVTAVYVDENQWVKAGQVIADLDPRDFQTAADQARGQLRQAQSQTTAERPNVPLTQVTSQTTVATTEADVAGAEANLASAQGDLVAAVERIREARANHIKAKADVERYLPLVEKDEIPRQQFDQALATERALGATFSANLASAAAAQMQVEQRRAQLAQAQHRAAEAQKNAPKQVAVQRANVAARQAAAAAAQAQLQQALLNLSYCKIVTPVDGIVARRNAEVGQRVSEGQQLVLVAQTANLWVTANFRETQLRHMQAGQTARIHVDALGTDFDGYVESMPAATGAVTSLLPPENATGNFVKVVQRLPVRLRFKQGQQGLERLRQGMSVVPSVRVR